MASPAATAIAPALPRRWPRCAPARRWSCQSWTTSPGQSRMRAIADELEKRGVSLALGKQVYDPNDPMGRMFFNILATLAEFESDLIRLRTREGMKIARDKGKLRGKPPANTRSATSASCSRSRDRRCIGRSGGRQTNRFEFPAWREVIGCGASRTRFLRHDSCFVAPLTRKRDRRSRLCYSEHKKNFRARLVGPGLQLHSSFEVKTEAYGHEDRQCEAATKIY